MCVSRDLDVITDKSADLALNPTVAVDRREDSESEFVDYVAALAARATKHNQHLSKF